MQSSVRAFGKTMQRPIVGITLDYLKPNRMVGGQIRLHVGYADAVAKAGGIPVFIPPMSDLDMPFDMFDGFVLAGSPFSVPDMPRLNPPDGTMAPRKSMADQKLIQHIIDHERPVLAVASGMLELCQFMGGKLIQDVRSELNSYRHMDLTGNINKHLIRIAQKSKLMSIIGMEEVRVNSYHKQAVKTVPAELLAVATSPEDNVIEAVESVNPKWFCIGVQWHPHSESANVNTDYLLFDALIDSSAKGKT